ncbi:MAG TPA: zinc-binding dehydrogenase [Vicinamibacteria bacterium]|nr:zinc-binding dehydrogenase [Vicinamibacteria bacterium]
MTARMKAAVLHGREDVRIEEVDVPRLEPGDVLLRTRVALTCGTDLKVYRRGYHARMIVPPALFGHEIAGAVEAVGEGVAEFRPGDRVVAANSAPCGRCEFCATRRESLCDDLMFWNGAYAEFARIPARVAARNLILIPEGVPDHKAAVVEPLACVMRGVEGLQAGESAAILGTGGIGLMFVALAKARGASVVAAGRKPHKLARARTLGADATIVADDRLAPALMAASPGGRGFHLVVEAAGQPAVSQVALEVVRKGGTVNLFAGCAAGTELRLDAPRVHYEEITISATFHHTPAIVREALALVAAGGFDPDVLISGREPLAKLPQVLADMARGGEALKTAIVP